MLDSNTKQPIASPVERNVVYIPKPGYYVFHLFSTQGSKLERKYNEIYAKPREDIIDTFCVSPLTTEASQITMIIYDFRMLDYTANINDEIWLEYPTYDGIRNVYAEDLGFGLATTEDFK